jgi:hypothetical protein
MLFCHCLSACSLPIWCPLSFRIPLSSTHPLIVDCANIYIYIYIYLYIYLVLVRSRDSDRSVSCAMAPAGRVAMASSGSAAGSAGSAAMSATKPAFWNDETGACLKYFRPFHITDYPFFCFFVFVVP